MANSFLGLGARPVPGCLNQCPRCAYTRNWPEIEFVTVRYLMFDSGELVTMGLGSDESLQKICAKSGC